MYMINTSELRHHSSSIFGYPRVHVPDYRYHTPLGKYEHVEYNLDSNSPPSALTLTIYEYHLNHQGGVANMT